MVNPLPRAVGPNAQGNPIFQTPIGQTGGPGLERLREAPEYTIILKTGASLRSSPGHPKLKKRLS